MALAADFARKEHSELEYHVNHISHDAAISFKDMIYRNMMDPASVVQK